MRTLIAIGLAVGAGTAFAQIGAPVLGYLPDGSGIRPVYGIRGAATVAPPLDFGRDFSRIAISPSQDYAIATDATSGTVLLIPSGGSAAPLTGAISNPDLISISPNGAAAILWHGNRGQIFSGLPGSPAVREVDGSFVTAYRGDPALTEAPIALSISDDGQWAAGSWERGTYALGPNAEVRPLTITEAPRAMSFFAGGHDLAIATAFHVFSIADVAGAATLSTLATQRTNPAGIGISSDNRRLVLADRAGSIYSLDLNTASMSQFNCGCMPQGAIPMGRGMFRLTGLANGSFRMLDAVRGELLFVPLMASQGGQQ
jgi:hypothetical protein